MAGPTVEIAEAAGVGVGVGGTARPSEDHVVRLPHAIVVADGATSLRPDLPGGGWYAERLCAALASRLTAEPAGDLRVVLGAAIGAVAGEHGLVPGAAPSSTVAILRWSDSSVDGLVLADSPVVVATGRGVEPLVDDRIGNRVRPGGYRKRLRAGGGFGADHVAALRQAGATTSALRNVDGGFWVAEADPAAAAHARVASWPRADVRAAVVATDGVSCGVDDYGLFDWPEVLATAAADGPAAVLAAVRAAETADPDGVRWPRPKRHDDQALVFVRF